MPKWVFRYFPFLLLGWAVRYFPILRIIKKCMPSGGALLDIGSGSIGLAGFYRSSFVGCDVEFPSPPRHPMLPVRCSGAQLPFADGAFSGVLASDVLEHVPPEYRLTVVKEALRVAGRFAIFGFPSGQDAFDSDRKFYEYLKNLGVEPFGWLEEHMRFAYPTLSLFDDLGPGWSVESFGNENIAFHDWISRSELSRVKKGVSWILLTVAPSLVEAALRLADRAPFYRLIVVVSRKPPAGAEAAC